MATNHIKMWLSEPWVKVVSKPFKGLVSISKKVADLLLFPCQLPETGPRIWVFDHGLPQTTKRRPLCRRFAPRQPGRNAAWKGQTSAHPEIDNEQKGFCGCQKCPRAGNTARIGNASLKHTETSVTIRSPAACTAALIQSSNVCSLSVRSARRASPPHSNLSLTGREWVVHSLGKKQVELNKNVAKLFSHITGMKSYIKPAYNWRWLVMQSTMRWPTEAAPTCSCSIPSVCRLLRSCSGSITVKILSQWQAGLSLPGYDSLLYLICFF